MKIRTKFGVCSLAVLVLLAMLVGGGLVALGRAKKAAAARHSKAVDLTLAVHTVQGSWLKVNDEIHDLLRRGFNAEDFQQLRSADRPG